MDVASRNLSWRAHPARSRPLQAAGGLGVIAAASGGVYLSVGSSACAVLAAAVLVAALNRFFFPSRFEINADGVFARYLLSRQSLRWPQIRRVAYDANGAYLGIRSKPSRLDAYRGLHILFGDRRDEVKACLRAHLAGPQESDRMEAARAPARRPAEFVAAAEPAANHP